jgi:cyclophilin family peptidyl-prolyl cis-trans isomerase
MFPADENDLVIRRGAIGMRSQGFENGRKLVKSQFYIVLSDNPPSDGQFSYVFGYLTAGYSVCDELSKMGHGENVIISDLGIFVK